MKEDFKQRFKQLLKIKETPSAKIGRGTDFENLINDVFEDEGILLKRSYHSSDNKAEQIDGAIELLNRIILFEVKWVESGLAASDLYAFIGKVENKLIGTLGLFISKEELSDNFVNSLSKGRRRNVLLFHGNDIQLLFAGDLSLTDYLSDCIRRYSFDNIMHYDASSFVKSQKFVESSRSEPDLPPSNTESIKNILGILFADDIVVEYIVDFELKKLTLEEKGQLANYLLEKYPQFYDAFISSLSKRNRNQFSNMHYALSELVKQKEVTRRIVDKYYELYCGSVNERYLQEFLWESFRSGYETLKDKDRFQNTLYENLKGIIGNYDKENLLSRVIKDIWPTIDKELQNKFVYEYLEIFFSDRKDRYDQKRFARELITTNKYMPIFKQWLETKIKVEIASTELTVADIPNEVKYFARRYKEMMFALALDESAWHTYITELYKAQLK
jgi:hypothetical protein